MSQEQVPSMHGTLQSFRACADPDSNKDITTMGANIVGSDRKDWNKCKRRYSTAG